MTDERTEQAKLQRMRSQLLLDRSSFDAHWQEIAEYLKPRRLRFDKNDRNKGDRRNQKIIDSTGTFALRTLQSGLHAGLTSPARPWLRLTTPDPDLAEFPRVKEWLHTVTQRMLTVFLQSNLYNALPVVYGDMGGFGTAAMSLLEDNKDLFRCRPYPIGSYALGVNDRDVVSSFVRDYQLSVEQLVQTFGGPGGSPLERGQDIEWANFSARIKTAYDAGDYYQAVDVVWVVFPNLEADATRLRAWDAMPFRSAHFEHGCSENKLLRRSGFRSFPVLAPRWEVTGEDAYGTDCPGMMALGDVKQLQGMTRDEGKAIKKMVDPPLKGPSTLKNQKTSLLPGDITFVDERSGQSGLSPIHEVRPDLGAFAAAKNEVQYRINRAFFADLFLMLASSDGSRGAQPLTAREVAERHEEKLLAVGPVLERTNDELLDPLVDRAFELMERSQLLPEAPEELDGVTLRVEYTSLMAQAQKLVAVGSHDRFVQSVVGLSQVFPEQVAHKINVGQIVDEYADLLGVNPKLIRSDEEAQQIAASQAEAQQQQAQAEQMALAARTAKDFGATPVGGDTALSRLGEVAAAL